MSSVRYPQLLRLADPAAYQAHFVAKYCQGPIPTFDGIKVWFRPNKFQHDFFESSNRDGIKDQFSVQRAERMDWIEATLNDPTATLKQGWIKAERRHDPQRRVAVVKGNYVVVIAINRRNPKKANFVTAFVADTQHTLNQILTSPSWP